MGSEGRRAGRVLTQYHLGAMYYAGRSVPQDDAEAGRCFHLAANAQSSLGDNGRGVAQDYADAREWLAKNGKAG